VIGVITGLHAEARCLSGLDLEVACSGARPGRARAEAARLLAYGAWGLVSFGLAAGLRSDLRPGDLVLATTVVLVDGRRLPSDAAWRCRLAAALAEAGVATRAGPVAGTDRLLASPGQKRALLEATGALAADMESHAVAELASAAARPFIVVRAISDAADQALPAAATRFLGPEGQIRPAALIGVIARPRELAELVRLGLQTRRALAALHRAARSAGGSLERSSNRPRSAGDRGS
jgi:adenosylhomocysteine nucleosidase